MQITITTAGVTFDLATEDCTANEAVKQALRVAELCGFAPRGLAQLGGSRMLARISRVRGAAVKRQLFADRLAAELGFRGLQAEVVA